MIVVDSSALIAILDNEPDAVMYAEALAEADAVLISAATLLETAIVMINRHGERSARVVDELVQEAGLEVESVTVHQVIHHADHRLGPAGRNQVVEES